MPARREDPMKHRGACVLIGALALAGAMVLAAPSDAVADSRHGGGGGRGGSGGGWHHGGVDHRHFDHFHHNHFHSFVFVGAGFGAYYPYYPYYYPYPAYPAYYPPPTYVSQDQCYQPPVPRGPGVADLYTCSGQYVGPIAVP
jgi:hypothetical protein